MRDDSISTTPLAASHLNVNDLFIDQVSICGAQVAVRAAEGDWTYADLHELVNRLCALLQARGVQRGDRVALLSENRREYVLTLLAAARLGAIAACLNWRQSPDELDHCIQLVQPRLALVSPRYVPQIPLFRAIERDNIFTFGDAFDALLQTQSAAEHAGDAHPEDGLHILYTSGTTGKPKAALISHRALIARGAVGAMDRGYRRGSTFVAWAPMFHMVSADNVLVTLINGGQVNVVDGFQLDALCNAVEQEQNLGWLVLMPGMIDKVVEALTQRGIRPQPMDAVGCMADLIPRHQLAEVTRLFNAPYRNTFGSTETGPAPGGGGLVGVGVVPESLGKRQSSLCRVRLVDVEGRDVAPGEPGELLLRSPTLFSGYWGMPEATAEAFEDGWFHSGDVFVREADGALRFVDRRKYLIKSGGENIYPAEIEQLLLASPRIIDAAVVRQQDAKWGEVPVAFVIAADADLTPDEVIALCHGKIANYKLPKAVHFILDTDMPRSTTGKVMRNVLEAQLKEQA
ncbi:MAG: class I adenylate-forming enzyme family protein [Janthinobacterium lividum]